MHSKYTSSHLARKAAHEQLLTSPDAVNVGMNHPDPLVREMYQLALVDSSLAGFKHMAPRYSDKRINSDGTPVQLTGYALVTDDPMPMSALERVEMQLNEMDAMKQASQPEQYGEQLSPTNQRILLDAIRAHVAPESIRKVGGLGVDGRRYPEGHERAGHSIPTKDILNAALRQERANKLFVDVAGMVAPDGGAQLTGNPLDAMHRRPMAASVLAGRPEEMAAVDNIYMGPNSLNQSDGKRVGEQLEQSRASRLSRLLGERHELETGSPAVGNADQYSRSDDRLLKEIGIEALVREHQYRRDVERRAGELINELAGGRMSEMPDVVTQPIIERSAVAKNKAVRGGDVAVYGDVYTNGKRFNGG